MKKLAVFVTMCLIAAGGAYFVYLESELAEMTVETLDGKVVLVRDGESKPVDGTSSIKPGDFITTSQGSSAQLRLAGERRAFLDESVRLLVVDERSLETRSGSIRVRTSHHDAVQVEFDGISAQAFSAHFRIDVGEGTSRVGSYEGDVELSAPGQPRLELSTLFQAETAAGELPRSRRPYKIRAGDGWDADVLEDVIVLDQNLTNLGNGLASQLGFDSARPSLGYFAGLTNKPVGFMSRFLKRSTEDLLIGFTVAENSESAGFRRAYSTAFKLRDQGGRWGVVASILRAPAKDVLGQVKSLVVATRILDGGDGGDLDFSLAAAQRSTGGSVDIGDTGGGTNPGDDPVDPGDPNDPKKPEEPKDPDPPDECENSGDCGIKDITDRLPGLPDPSPSDEDDDPEDTNPLSKGILDKKR